MQPGVGGPGWEHHAGGTGASGSAGTVPGGVGQGWDLLPLVSVQLHISDRRIPLVSEAHPPPAISQSLLT